MKIAIIGAGALGSLFGGLLARGGEEVWLFDPIARDHVAKIDREGLVIEEGQEERIKIRATTKIEDVGKAQLVALFVKAPATEAAIRGALPAMGPSTMVLSLQNGLGIGEILERYVPQQRILRGVTAQGSTFVEPGRIRHAGRGPTWIGPLSSLADKTALEAIVDIFSRSGIETHIEENVTRLVWKKLLVNAGINALTAIFNVPNGELVTDPVLRAIMGSVVREAVIVAQAAGFDFDSEETVCNVEEVCHLTAENLSSMLQDVRRGSTTEIDYINGAVVREGRCRGLTPALNMLLTELIKRRYDEHNQR
jgi:2-dehydropantoate 2-reductase